MKAGDAVERSLGQLDGVANFQGLRVKKEEESEGAELFMLFRLGWQPYVESRQYVFLELRRHMTKLVQAEGGDVLDRKLERR